jgi:hypothetical protein
MFLYGRMPVSVDIIKFPSPEIAGGLAPDGRTP